MFLWIRRSLLGAVIAIAAPAAAIGDSVLDNLQVEGAAPEDQELALPQSVVSTSASTPLCSPGQTATWREAWDFGQGVDAFDPEGHRIGFSSAIKDAWWQGKNWYPLDGYKHRLCGVLHKFNFYDPWTSGDEADWNNFIIPAESYRFLIEDVLPLENGSWHDCRGDKDCLEGEVTPDEGFYRNPWFDRRYGDEDDSSPLEGKGLCTYGPWVYEEAHGNRPEIHPSELVWWRERVAAGPFYLLLLQDDSNRFDREEDYALQSNWTSFPNWWRPWSKFPRMAEFRIAFELDPRSDAFAFRVFDRVRQKNVVTGEDPNASKDADSGRNHAIVYDGRAVISVLEQQAKDSDLGVKFVEICRNQGNTRLQGYFSLTAKVGAGDQGKEGYMALGVERLPPEDGNLLVVPTEVTTQTVIRPEFVEEGLRRLLVDGQPKLLADVRLRLLGATNDQAPTVTSARIIGRNSTVSAELRGSEGRDDLGVLEVPILEATSIELLNGDQRVSTHRLPQIALAPERRASATVGNTDPNAWSQIARSLGLQTADAPPSQLRRIETWKLEVSPFYAPVRDGEASREDDSPVAEQLTEAALARDPEEREELFGEERPFEVSWSFVAREVPTGRRIEVSGPDGTISGAPISVRTVDEGVGPGMAVEVDFTSAPQGVVYEVMAKATVSDTLGLAGSTTFEVSSHGLSGPPRLVELSVDLALPPSLPPDDRAIELARQEVLEDVPSIDPEDARGRRARVMYATALEDAADGVVTIEELGNIVNLAGQLLR